MLMPNQSIINCIAWHIKLHNLYQEIIILQIESKYRYIITTRFNSNISHCLCMLKCI